MSYELQTPSSNLIDSTLQRQVNIKGIDFPEDLLAELIANHMSAKGTFSKPTFATAFEIYMRESNAPTRRNSLKMPHATSTTFKLSLATYLLMNYDTCMALSSVMPN
jgi:hypothetical protein